MASAIFAQTPQPQAVLTPGTSNTWILDWEGIAGRTYFLQHSEDLVAWQYFPLIESGNNATLGWGFASSADKFFVRLRYTDQPTSNPDYADFDGDGLTNWQEVAIYDTDPFNPDSDGDGMPDGWEVAHGLDPRLDDADGLFQQGPFTNLYAFQAGVQSDPNATIGDYDGDGIENDNDSKPFTKDEFIVTVDTNYLNVYWEHGIEHRSTSSWSESFSIDRTFMRYPEYGVYVPISSVFTTPQSNGNLETVDVHIKATSQSTEVRKVRFLDFLDTSCPSLYSPTPSITLRELVEFVIPAGSTQSNSISFDPGVEDIDSYTPFLEQASYLARAEVVVSKDGESSAPSDGLIIKKSDTARYRVLPDMPDSPTAFEDEIKWFWRILKWDGTSSDWTAYQDGEGHTFTAQPIDAGIYEVKAEIDGEIVFYMRSRDDPHSSKKRGENECFGVVDEQWQINVRNQAKNNLGSVAYAQGIANSNVPAGPPGGYKCNLFVGHKATDAGAVVEKINGNNPLSKYHPTANQWAGTEIKTIPNWTLLPPSTYPQPGFVVARGAPGGIGHTGIVDYDGAWISAGTTNVNRIADVRTYIPSRFRKYTP